LAGTIIASKLQAWIEYLQNELTASRSRLRGARSVKEAMLRRVHAEYEVYSINNMIAEYESEVLYYEAKLELLGRVMY